MSSSGFKRKRPRSGDYGGRGGTNKSAASQQQSKASQWSANIPISLGKPSLRRRLEDYYSLISPDVIQNEKEWKNKFELIYEKYGGSVQGEYRLAQKLAKKYGGNIIRLKLTTSASGKVNSNTKEKNQKLPSHRVRPESWYDSNTNNNSGILDFTSVNFDPIATLSKSTPVSKVYDANPNPFAFKDDKGILIPVPFLDNISKFQGYLPTCDPLYKAPIARMRKRDISDGGSTSTETATMKKKIPVFTAMAAQFEHADAGPLSMLHSIHVQRQRVRVLVRYVDCIRGTLTGYLVAFDKHFNMILRDVDEVYTSRITKVLSLSTAKNKKIIGRDDENNESVRNRNDNENTWTKGELEERRRRCLEKTLHSHASGGGGGNRHHHSYQQKKNISNTAEVADDRDKNGDRHQDASLQLDRLVRVGKRHMHQILVRGDNVVSVWRANGEQREQKRRRFSYGRDHQKR